MKVREYLHYTKDGYVWKDKIGLKCVDIGLENGIYISKLAEYINGLVEEFGEGLHLDSYYGVWDSDPDYIISRLREETEEELAERKREIDFKKEKELKELERLKKKYEVS